MGTLLRFGQLSLLANGQILKTQTSHLRSHWRRPMLIVLKIDKEEGRKFSTEKRINILARKFKNKSRKGSP